MLLPRLPIGNPLTGGPIKMVLRPLLMGFLSVFWAMQALAADTVPSDKRGLLATDLTPEDMALAASSIGWWYNWSGLPTEGLRESSEQHGIMFVPMVWGTDIDQTAYRRYLQAHPEIHYLLGFNEPNFATQANLTPQQAAEIWPQLEAIADEFSLRIIGPSVNYSPGDVDIPGASDRGSPFAYLDAFFQACQGCRVDAIGVHGYMTAPAYFEEYVRQFHERYQKPVWVTEWNLNNESNTQSVEQSMDFMAATVRWMESRDYVTHYAWFMGRGAGSSDLLTHDHQWTALGTLYQRIPPAAHVYTLPGTLEAESANTLQGVHHRTTQANGRPVIQLFTDSDGATLTFNVASAEQRTYQWTLQYAAHWGATLGIRVDDQPEQRVPLDDTGSQYYWQQHHQSITIPAGQHRLSIRVINGRPGFDWMRFE